MGLSCPLQAPGARELVTSGEARDRGQSLTSGAGSFCVLASRPMRYPGRVTPLLCRHQENGNSANFPRLRGSETVHVEGRA